MVFSLIEIDFLKKSKFEGVIYTFFELMKPFLSCDLAASTSLHLHS